MPKIHHQNAKSAIRAKFGEKKFFRKKFIGSDTPAAKPPQGGGYGTDLQSITIVRQLHYIPFVNKKKFFSTRIEFQNLYKSKIS